MLSISLGNSTEAYTRVVVKGLPPLEVPVGCGGYLDGYVIHAKSLQKVYLTRSYDDVPAMALAVGYEQNKALAQYRTGSLAALQLMNTWARVQIIKRLSVSKVSVYFVDTGAEQDVDISNLYELPPKLRNSPPLAIPISMNDPAPEVTYDELQKLKRAKVAVKLNDLSRDGTIGGSEFTVFDKGGHNNRPVVNALQDPEFSWPGKEVAVFKRQGLTSTVLVTTTTAASTTANPGEVNVVVIVIAVLCCLLFIGALAVAALCIIRRIRQKRQEQEQAAGGIQNAGQVSNKSERTPEKEIETKMPPVIALPTDALAVVTATIALANLEKDVEKEKTREKDDIGEEEELPGNPISIPKHRSLAGLSQISSIYSSHSLPPRCSTPAIPSIFTPLRPSLQPNSEPVVLRSEPLPDDLDISGYSDILDVRDFVGPSILNHTIEPNNETTFMTAPDVSEMSQ